MQNLCNNHQKHNSQKILLNEQKIKDHDEDLNTMGNRVEEVEIMLKSAKAKVVDHRNKIESLIDEIDKSRNKVLVLKEKCKQELAVIFAQENEAENLEKILQDHDEEIENLLTEGTGNNSKLQQLSQKTNSKKNVKVKKESKTIEENIKGEHKAMKSDAIEKFEEGFEEDYSSEGQNYGTPEPARKNIYELQKHCPNCKKIIKDRELKLLAKGFSPQCPACGHTLDPSLIE